MLVNQKSEATNTRQAVGGGFGQVGIEAASDDFVLLTESKQYTRDDMLSFGVGPADLQHAAIQGGWR